MTFSGIFVPGLNQETWLASPSCRVLTFFMTAELRARSGQVDFLPLCYQDIPAELRRRKPAAALFMCSPPDAAGYCSFGTEVAFIAELWREIPVRIAHINPRMPRTAGDEGIPFRDVSAYIECDQPLLTTSREAQSPEVDSIAAHVAQFVANGATVQTGLGKIPDAVLQSLASRRGLRVHTGLMGQGVLALARSGALAGDGSAVVGVAIGDTELYEGLDHPALQFRPVSVTHGVDALARIDDLVTINSANEVDLFGQAYAEMTSTGWMSGPGGASDFARGARVSGGTRIVALKSVARDRSRIVAAGAGSGPVSLGRMDIDIVVTEYGYADLRAKDHDGRAEAIIAVAAPEHRPELRTSWSGFSRRGSGHTT
jgi:acyl-CoA hydrolase